MREGEAPGTLSLARCTVAGEDLGKWLVANGWALAYRRYSLDYVHEESGARAARPKPERLAGYWDIVGRSGDRIETGARRPMHGAQPVVVWRCLWTRPAPDAHQGTGRARVRPV